MARHGEREAALQRNEVVGHLARKMVWVVVGLSVLSAFSVMIAAWALNSKPEPRYFATRQDGGILPIVAVSTPFLTDNQVMNFAVEASTSAMTINFSTWREDLRRSSVYFERPAGWNSFIDAIEDSRQMDFIRERRFITTAVANGATIIRSGLDENNRYSWTVQVPMTITYQSASEQTSQDILAEMVVSRLPTYESPQAVGVSRLVMRSGSIPEEDLL